MHPGAKELVYEIRQIVAVGEKIERLGVPVYWENIGDPIAKGQKMPKWIKDIVSDLVANDDSSWGYSPTKGVLETRQYLAAARNAEGGVDINAEDILFFNGLGDAIQTLFMYLNQHARVIGPSPAYSTHSSAEGAHAKSEHLTYNLLPENGWMPDLEDLRNKVKYNPSIAGILIINPDNPTGIVYSEEVLKGMVAIAREFGLFLMCDEIYTNITYGDQKMCPLSKVIGGVPGMALKGLSKEIPWPGSRCGWVEFYNTTTDEQFAEYVESIVQAKQLEVCSTTLPQKALPKILGDERYPAHLQATANSYAKKAELLADAFTGVAGVTLVKPQGAFYASPVFNEGVLRDNQTLSIENDAVRTYIEKLVEGASNDKRFVYYLLGATGICVVPLSGMNSTLEGFRMTLLEPDEEKFKKMLTILTGAIAQYLQS